MNPGEVVGSYRIIRALGEGGMGAVYEVEHLKLGVHYALKTFTLQSGEVELFRRRFLAEGKVLARLSHPNIARVFDLDFDEASGAAYFVMDLVHYKDGESYTLADLEVGGADEEHLVRWFAQLASAIDYIHQEGIIHRDIKLNNVLLNDKGGVTLSDFGISRFVGDRIRSQVDVTRTIVSHGERQVTGNLIMGTEGYMAPEILRGVAATAASDTYALGIAFFRLLTGIWYESGTNVLQLLDPFEACWKEILPAMLATDAAKRPVNLTALAERLKASLASVSLSEAPTKIRPSRISRPLRQRLSPRVWMGIGVAAALAGALALAIWLRPADEKSFYDHLYDIPECLS